MTKTDPGEASLVVRVDQALSHGLARYRHHPLARAAGWAAEAADQPQLIGLSVATLVVGALAGRRDLVRGGARMLAAELLATAGKAAVKRLVDRSRPGHALASGDHRFRGGDSDEHELTSFPSGHTAGAVAVSLAAAREIDGVAVPAALATAGVAAAQAPSGHHYLGDVMAGAAIGWLAEALVEAAFARWEATSVPATANAP